MIGRVRQGLPFVGLLALYTVVVLAASKSVFQGDEARYVRFASNLSHGFYSPADNVDLWNGPGYPLVLLPFVLLKLPWLAAKLLNPLLLLGTVVFFYLALRLYMPKRPALYGSLLLGIYPPLLREAYLLLTEPLTFFLVGGFVFSFCKLHCDGKRQWTTLLAASAFLGYLTLTKIFFGQVLLAGLVLFGLLYLATRNDAARKTILVCSFAMVFCLPYLVYTYSLTGRFFYWGDSGGSSLYWISTPYPNELGDWQNEESLARRPEFSDTHRQFYSSIANLGGVQKDDALRNRAIYNITHDPVKFAKNWVANVGRLLFSYPFSFTPQKLSTFFFIAPNMFIVVIAALCLYPTYRARVRIPHEVFVLLALGVVAFIGSSLVSAYFRQFSVLVPLFGLWMAYTLTCVIRVELRH